MERFTKREAEQIARFVTENHDRIREGITIGRHSNGTLRLKRLQLAIDARERTAAKLHGCDGNGSRDEHHPLCPRAIERGDVYVEYLGESPAYTSGSRHSIPCAEWLIEEVG